MGCRTMSAVLTALACAPPPAASWQSAAQPAAAPARAEVLVLGVYHMANPGRDIFNMQADDVLSTRRQAEIAEVVAVLKQFQPTKVALEREFSDTRLTRSYADYLAGTYELTRNEVDQLGLRLARELGHSAVYPVDVDGEFPFQHVVNFARAKGRADELEALMEETGGRVSALNEHLASHSILETLLLMNSDERVAEDVASYYAFVRFGEAWDWAGADLVAAWWQRNLRIYSNVMRLIDSPSDRVLVIFGAGHLGWLRTAFSGSADFRVRKLAEFVR